MILPELTLEQKKRFIEMCSNPEQDISFNMDFNTVHIKGKRSSGYNVNWYEYLLLQFSQSLAGTNGAECWKDISYQLIDCVNPIDGSGFQHPIDFAYKLYKKRKNGTSTKTTT